MDIRYSTDLRLDGAFGNLASAPYRMHVLIYVPEDEKEPTIATSVVVPNRFDGLVATTCCGYIS